MQLARWNLICFFIVTYFISETIMHTGEMLTQRFILNDFCQQLTLQSNIKLADYVNKDTTKAATYS